MEDLKTITHAIFSASIHLTPSGSLLKSVGESFESEFRRNHLVWNLTPQAGTTSSESCWSKLYYHILPS